MAKWLITFNFYNYLLDIKCQISNARYQKLDIKIKLYKSNYIINKFLIILVEPEQELALAIVLALELEPELEI